MREQIIAGVKGACLARTAASFKKCFDDWKRDNPNCDCLDSLIIIGESGSNFGGGDTFDDLENGDLFEMRQMMCDHSNIEYRSCSGLSNSWFWGLVYELQKGHTSIDATAFSGLVYPSGRHITGRKVRIGVNFPGGTIHLKGPEGGGLALAGYAVCTDRCYDTYLSYMNASGGTDSGWKKASREYWECIDNCRKLNLDFHRFLFD